MQTLKKFYFGKSKSKPNTFIGGVGDVITNASQVASSLGLTANRVRGFVKKGNNIEFEVIGGTYNMQHRFISGSNITYFIDKDGLVTSFGQSFSQCLNLERLEFPKCTYIYGGDSGGWLFTTCPKLKYVYIPLCINFGQTVGEDKVFRPGYPLSAKFYIPASLQSANSGNPDGDLITGIGNGIIVRYVTNSNKPNAVTDLSTGAIYNTAIQLNFTHPTGSTNAIDFYEVYLNNSPISYAEITASGQFITGLTPNTNYNIKVIAVDVFYNKSVFSNSINVSTTNKIATDTDAISYINVSSNALYQDIIDDTFKSLKSSNLYSKIQAFYPFLGTTQAQHKWNAKNPLDVDAAFRLVFTGGGTHSNLGYQCNGTNAYANTFLTPSVVQNINSNGFTITVGTNNSVVGSAAEEMGAYVSETNSSVLTAKEDNTLFTRIASFNNNTNVNRVRITGTNEARGIYTGTKTASNLHKLIRNSVVLGSGKGAGTLPSVPVWIGALNLNNSPYGYSNQRIQFVAIHEGLTDAEVQTLHTIIDAFETAVGRKTW